MRVVLAKEHIMESVEPINSFANVLKITQKIVYVLKLDIEGFFMHINKEILFSRLQKFIEAKYKQNDKELVLEICHKIIFNSPTENCIIKGAAKNWEGLPKNKSLFHSPQNSGLPIGNLTSQIFANFYMSAFRSFYEERIGYSLLRQIR